MRASTELFGIFRGSGSLGSFIAGTSTPRLILCTWNPYVKGKGFEVSSARAKSMRSLGDRVELLGHAAARLEIDTLSEEMQEILKYKFDGEEIKKIVGEMSWFPAVGRDDHYIKTGEQFSDEQHDEFKARQEILIGKEGFEKAAPLAAGARHFFSQEVVAVNSSIDNDIKQYGKLKKDGVRVFTELDFDKILPCWLKMMEPTVMPTESGDNVLSMTTIAPGGTYDGTAMLEFFKGAASPGITHGDSSYSSPQHVCTTAVLESLKAGLGPERFEEITRIVLERPEFAHRLAVVDLAREVINEAAAQTEPRYRVDEDSTQTNTAKKTDTPSSDNDESPSSPGLR